MKIFNLLKGFYSERNKKKEIEKNISIIYHI